MNNFPAMTEAQLQELIELCEAVLAGHVQYGGDSNEEDIYKIALAALTAEHVAIVEPRDYVTAAQLIGEEPLSKSVRPLFEGALFMGQKLYASPPAPVLRAEDGWKLVPIEPTEDMVIRGFESAPDEVLSDADVWEEFDAMSGCQQAAHKARLCYAAMLAAAPEAE